MRINPLRIGGLVAAEVLQAFCNVQDIHHMQVHNLWPPLCCYGAQPALSQQICGTDACRSSKVGCMGKHIQHNWLRKHTTAGPAASGVPNLPSLLTTSMQAYSKNCSVDAPALWLSSSLYMIDARHCNCVHQQAASSRSSQGLKCAGTT